MQRPGRDKPRLQEFHLAARKGVGSREHCPRAGARAEHNGDPLRKIAKNWDSLGSQMPASEGFDDRTAIPPGRQSLEVRHPIAERGPHQGDGGYRAEIPSNSGMPERLRVEA